jgi:hypothetical protein
VSGDGFYTELSDGMEGNRRSLRSGRDDKFGAVAYLGMGGGGWTELKSARTDFDVHCVPHVSEIEHQNGLVDSFYFLRLVPCRKDWRNSCKAWAVACTD